MYDPTTKAKRKQEAKEKSMVSYLETKGYFPVDKRRGNYYYHSPFRNDDKDASFVVSMSRKIYKDFGTSRKAGDVIDLVMRIDKVSYPKAIDILLEGEYSNVVYTPKDEEEKIKIKYTKSIDNKHLISYLCDERSLDIDLVSSYCEQVGFSFDDKRVYSGLGFKNKKGGWEIRNSWFKGGTSPKYYSQMGEGLSYVFEGFIDFLSWLQYKGLRRVNGEVIVLNSTVNWKYIDWRKKEGFLMLDNDSAGDDTTREIMKLSPSFFDCRGEYEGYNDINKMLTEQKRARKNYIKKFILGHARV